MSMKFDHVVTTIIKSHDTNALSVAKLQGRIESHVNRILEKTKKVVKEESLKSRVNFNNTTESSCIGEERVQSNYNNKGRESYRGRGRGNYGERGRGNFNHGETTTSTTSIQRIKGQVDIASSLHIMAEKEVTTIKKGKNVVFINVKILDTKQLIADTNIRQMWLKVLIKIP